MLPDRRKKYSIHFKVDEIELQIIKEMALDLGVDESQAIRMAIWSLVILHHPELKIQDALKLPIPDNVSFWDALRPFPELANHLGIEIKAWRRKQGNEP